MRMKNTTIQCKIDLALSNVFRAQIHINICTYTYVYLNTRSDFHIFLFPLGKSGRSIRGRIFPAKWKTALYCSVSSFFDVRTTTCIVSESVMGKVIVCKL